MVAKKNTRIRKGLDAVRKNIADIIAQQGWAVITIQADVNAPAHSYTIGLTDKGLPEVIIFGLPAEDATSLLGNIAHQLVDGLSYSENTPLTKVFAGANAYLKPVAGPAARENLRLASEFYPEGIAGLQLVWPDETGLFPWQEGFNELLRAAQPLLFHRNLH
jgi:hypothetical protein